MILTGPHVVRRALGGLPGVAFSSPRHPAVLLVTLLQRMLFYNQSHTTSRQETMMGSTLYNKIYLGRGAIETRRMQLAMALGLAASVGLGWYAFRSLR
jgi:hypothetical protein